MIATKEGMEAALRCVLAMLDEEAALARENHKKYGNDWDSYAQGVEFSVQEVRAAVGMEVSDEDQDHV